MLDREIRLRSARAQQAWNQSGAQNHRGWRCGCPICTRTWARLPDDADEDDGSPKPCTNPAELALPQDDENEETGAC